MKAQLSRLMRDATAVRAIEYGLITAGFAAAIFAISTVSGRTDQTTLPKSYSLGGNDAGMSRPMLK